MKKILAMLLAMVMLISLTACGDKKAPAEEIGIYVICEVESDGEILTYEDLAAFGMEEAFVLELKEDGTGSMTIFDETLLLKWKDGNLEGDGDKIPYTYADGKLTLDIEGEKMTFQKADQAPVTDAAPDRKESEEKLQALAGGMDLGDARIVYKGAELWLDSDGNEAIAVVLDYTNTSGEEKSFMWSVYYVAEQGGTELDSASVFLNEETTDMLSDTETVEIADGETTEVKVAFTLANLSDDVTVTFSDLMDDHVETVTITMDEVAEANPDSGSSSPNEGMAVGENQPYWEGEWYGWIAYTNGSDYYADMIDDFGDCVAEIVAYEDGTGNIMLGWLDGSEMGNVEVTFGPGTTDAGCMMSESGYIIDEDVEHADWIIDPGASMVSSLEHMIHIEGRLEDDNGEWLDYDIFLRPWGMDWEDVKTADTSGMVYEDMMPLQYENWYLPAVASGLSAMEALDSPAA